MTTPFQDVEADSLSEDVLGPLPDDKQSWPALVSLLAGVFNGREADYVSTPITSGRRFMDWSRTEGLGLKEGTAAYKLALKQQVIVPNCIRAKAFADELRKQQRIVIEPTALDVADWSQNDYRHLWRRVIERYVVRLWLLDGWQYSSGCTYEFYIARKLGIETLSEGGHFIAINEGTAMIEAAIKEMTELGHRAEFLESVYGCLRRIRHSEGPLIFKDEVLDRLAGFANVAQFVSFSPGDTPEIRHCRISGIHHNHGFSSLDEAIKALLVASPDGTVNVRSFQPQSLEGKPFIFGVKSVEDAVAHVKHLASQGLYTIVNETIDIHDGGVSGVLADEIVEFAPDDTPRCVERQGTARLSKSIAEQIISRVYSFSPGWNFEPTFRVEFSVHPIRRGFRRQHTIIWEVSPLDENWEKLPRRQSLEVGIWPNNFSQFLGDKLFGLLIAESLGAKVPRTRAIHRRLPPFEFGVETKTAEHWLRTSPPQNEPGMFPTHFGWRDPFELMKSIESTNEIVLPAILSQEAVESAWSGSLITTIGGAQVEGVKGVGDQFMMGRQPPQQIPDSVVNSVLKEHQRLQDLVGPVGFEWAFDGQQVWILQLHKELTFDDGDVLVPGDATKWNMFDVSCGLAALRATAEEAAKEGSGILLSERVALTSHMAGVLRRTKVPARVRTP